MVRDLTHGNTAKTLIRFTIPMLISVCFQQFYNIADSIIAGKFLGGDAIASIGISYTITMIYMAIANGSNIGCCVVISQFFGSKNYNRMKTCITTSIFSVIMMSAILTVGGITLSKLVLNLLNTPSELFADSISYLNIYTAGLIFLFLYNISTGIFTALGDSKTPLYFLIFSSALNVFLDYILVKYTTFGVTGIAIATFFAQGLSSVLSLIFLINKVNKIKTTKFSLFSLEILKKILFVAVPSILQQSFVSVGNIFIQSLVNTFGAAVVAGFSAAGKLNTFTITTLCALGNSMSSFTAQNVGANKIDRIKKGVKNLYIMSYIITLPLFVLYFFFPEKMMQIFIDVNSTEIIEVGTQFLKIVSPFYLFIAIKLIIDGVLRGCGKMKMFMTSTFSDLLLRVALSYLLVPVFNELGIWYSWPIGWLLATIISSIFFFSGKWKKNINNLAAN